MHGFNTQTTEGDYRIQFQTDTRDEWLLVQQLCRDIMDGEKLSQPQRWIPVTEKPPKEDTEVIVSCTDDSGDYEYSYTTTGWHFNEVWVVNNERSYFVRAWMSLPEPWKDKRGNGNE